MDSFDDELKQEFISEALETLEEAETTLLRLEEGADFKTSFDNLFRVFHSLKGGAGMFGIDDVQSLVHQVETLLDKERNSSKIPENLTNYIFSAIDWTRALLAGRPADVKSFDPGVQEPAKVRPVEPALQERVGNPKAKIFIVDDEGEILSLLEEVVSEIGYQVVTFTEAKKALAAISSEKPYLVISDFRMPEMDGIEMATQIRSIDSQLPVLMVTGFLTKEVFQQGLNVGIDAFLDKPFELTKVQSLVTSLVDKYRATQLLKKSIKFIMYQFSDLNDFLRKNGKTDLADSFRKELEDLMDQSRSLQKLG